MKKLLLLLMVVLFNSYAASAQMQNVWQNIQQNKRKAQERQQLEAVLATLPQDYVVAYSKDGVLCYLLKDGERISFIKDPEPAKKYVWYSPVVELEDDKAKKLAEKNRLAELIERLSAEGWKMTVSVGGEYEVYTFNRPKELQKTAK